VYVESENEILSITIFNAQGHKIYAQESGVEIEVKEWSSGLYSLMIETADENVILKLVIQ